MLTVALDQPGPFPALAAPAASAAAGPAASFLGPAREEPALFVYVEARGAARVLVVSEVPPREGVPASSSPEAVAEWQAKQAHSELELLLRS